MNIVISIRCDNAAFEGRPEDEVSRILLELSKKLTTHDLDSLGRLMDINGNAVGTVQVWTQGAKHE